ncbi:MAG: hypothetical protein WA996_12595 [Candidatus Promineifilaceae bacterium]
MGVKNALNTATQWLLDMIFDGVSINKQNQLNPINQHQVPSYAAKIAMHSGGSKVGLLHLPREEMLDRLFGPSGA